VRQLRLSSCFLFFQPDLVVHVHGSLMELDPEVNDERESDVLLSVRVIQN
jgi:hypothetical protein